MGHSSMWLTIKGIFTVLRLLSEKGLFVGDNSRCVRSQLAREVGAKEALPGNRELSFTLVNSKSVFE